MKRKLQIIFAAVTLGGLNAACTVSEVIHAEQTQLNVASLQVSEALLLDVGILHFDTGVPEDNDVEKTRIYPEVREAEARYLPYHIKTTLQGEETVTFIGGAVGKAVKALKIEETIFFLSI